MRAYPGKSYEEKRMNDNIDSLIHAVQTWLVTGSISPDILADDFIFSSPFWKEASKSAFLDKFLDPTEYIETSLSNITGFDPIINCVSKDRSYFTITLKYHTKNGSSVDEVVVCKVQDGLITEMKSIYDLSETLKAHGLPAKA